VYRFLVSPRWLALAAAVLVLVPVCIRLGFWQLDRYDARRERSARIQANLAAPPRPIAELLPSGGMVRPHDEWRRVEAVGTYDVGHQLLVRNRPYDGRPGFYVLTPLVAPDGSALLVNRGWVPTPTDAANVPRVPAPPGGEVSVLGRLRPPERQRSVGPRDGPGTPAGQVVRIDVPRIAQTLPYALRAGYVELVGEQPAPAAAPRPLEPADPGTGPHLAYAVQWWLFALIVAVGPVFLARREAAERATAGSRPLPS
jgi:cytochrome oxidase assembly protein ShyY1